MHRVKNALLPLLLCLLLAGCGQTLDAAPSAQESEAPPAEAAAVTDPRSLDIVLPEEVLDCLTVVREFPNEDTAYHWFPLLTDRQRDSDELLSEDPEGHWLPLLSVSETASLEAFQADTGKSRGVGFLFAVAALDQTAYDRLSARDIAGARVFAESSCWYYVCITATDCQYYRAGREIDRERADWAQWEALWDLDEQVCADIITRNGLTVLDA
ncbi:hypothetical protein [uncultured Dysosmobacter sp.]|uniref:hypothetical protein n=1 Tax=uncultured Dysosmobacter sp. TaxID=2591384 RepID=UPI002629CBC1|nr:hypothetical protein [uncultured Dysosmobacter sp.]